MLLGGCLLVVVWECMPEASKNRLRTVWDPDAGPENARTSAEGRFVGFSAGMEIFKKYPVTGVGLGNFVPYRAANVDGAKMAAHNTAASVLAETGLIGGLAFLLFVSGVFVNCHKIDSLAKRYRHPMLTMLARLGVACRNAFVLLLFSGLAGDNQQRFQWQWIAAFSVLAAIFAEAIVASENDALLEKPLPWPPERINLPSSGA